jgi:hypothetical protein
VIARLYGVSGLVGMGSAIRHAPFGLGGQGTLRSGE